MRWSGTGGSKTAFLSKPFDLRELSRTVRDVLDNGRVARQGSFWLIPVLVELIPERISGRSVSASAEPW